MAANYDDDDELLGFLLGLATMHTALVGFES